MKSYDETINDVFRRMEEFKTVRKKKRKLMTGIAAGFCCVCIVATIGISFHYTTPPAAFVDGQTGVHPGIFVPAEQNPTEEQPGNSDYNLGTAGSDQAANLPNNAEPTVPSKRVIYAYNCSESERYMPPENGEILITLPLYRAMEEYGDRVLYQIEVFLLKDAKTYVTDETEWMREFERFSERMTDEHLGLSTYQDGNGQMRYLLLGVVGKDFIENFPVSGQYGYCIQLSGDTTGGCTAEVPDIHIYNRKASMD